MAAKKILPKRKRPGQKNKPVHYTPIHLQRILVPIDFSEHSKSALKYAIPFAQQFKASIDLIYVVEPTIYPADFSFGQIGFPNVEEELRVRGNDELEKLITKEISGQVSSRKVVRTGKPFYEINQYAQEEDIDLIIIATHGHSGMEHILFGSTAEKVVRKAPCPVLVVRTGEHEFVNG
jgi:nucleotide-binding universal stress UspA family protein